MARLLRFGNQIGDLNGAPEVFAIRVDEWIICLILTYYPIDDHVVPQCPPNVYVSNIAHGRLRVERMREIISEFKGRMGEIIRHSGRYDVNWVVTMFKEQYGVAVDCHLVSQEMIDSIIANY